MSDLRILAVDDERMALNMLTRSIREALPDAEITACQSVSDVIEELRDGGDMPDVAFLDIEIPGMTGLELARLLKMSAPRVNIIFVTGYSQYALEALAMRPSGYLMKPVDSKMILAEMKNLRHPPLRRAPAKRVFVQCFGDFEVFVGGEAVRFSRTKAKEMLAYLVDRRGANCSAAKIASALWEDGVYDRARAKHFSVIFADMLRSLRQVNAENIVRKTGDLIAVDPSAFDCDYYMALSGDPVSVNSFMGEYMVEYSWAEFTTAALFHSFG